VTKASESSWKGYNRDQSDGKILGSLLRVGVLVRTFWKRNCKQEFSLSQCGQCPPLRTKFQGAGNTIAMDENFLHGAISHDIGEKSPRTMSDPDVHYVGCLSVGKLYW
jgi:hypothetical protein